MFHGLMPMTSRTTPTSTDSNARRNSTPNGDPPKNRYIPELEGGLLVGVLIRSILTFSHTVGCHAATKGVFLRYTAAPVEPGRSRADESLQANHYSATGSRLRPRPRPFRPLPLWGGCYQTRH